MTDDKWINVETEEQREGKGVYEWWTEESKTRLGTVKHAGVNIVLSRSVGRRENRICADTELSKLSWLQKKSDVISNAYVQDTSALKDGRYFRVTAKNSSPLWSILGGKTNNSAALLEILDRELTSSKGNPWRASDEGCFRAVLAVSCARKFVWHELSWTYFPATSDAPYKVDVYDGSFDSRCMRLVFIR